MKVKSKYDHSTGEHVFKDPEIIVPIIMDLIHPQSVLDVGCGVGNFLKSFKDRGVTQVLGIDGLWNLHHLRASNISDEEFQYHDLEKPFTLDQKFDLVMCLEVAEHISSTSALALVESLITSGDIVLFSAAVPYQGGQHHINEQWPDYWAELFATKGFDMIDCMRPILWNEPTVFWWYRQNMVIYANTAGRQRFSEIPQVNVNALRKIVHPRHYTIKAQRLYSIEGGRMSVVFYLKLLAKGILHKFGFKFYSHNNE